MARTATGTSRDAGAPILGARFWQPGKQLTGIYVRSFVTRLPDGKSGECFQFMCSEPKMIELPMFNGRVDFDRGDLTKTDKFAIGALTGIEMALDAVRQNNSWFKEFQLRDKVTFECIGYQENPNQEMSDMIEFMITVDR